MPSLTAQVTNGATAAINTAAKAAVKATTTTTTSPSSSTAVNTQSALASKLVESPSTVEVDGYSLSVGDVVSVGRRRTSAVLSANKDIRDRIDESVEFLKTKLGTSVYGVTTGFGGSADTRTEHVSELQISLLEHQLCGVLPSSFQSFEFGRGLENALPEEVVRGAMLIRVNSLARGHSAVRLVVLETLLEFLKQGITPVVPLRSSISASGDLSPLSYIAASITGHPDVKVITRINGKPEVMPSPQALKLHGITPVVLGPKEGLGLVNGTAVSASMATHALYDSHFLALLSQALTAMTVEAMVGHVGSFDKFIHDVTRPHPGQIEAARNIRTMLQGSSFAIDKEEELKVHEDDGVLRQDRYPLRTSAQWVGPMVQDLIAAHETLRIELNSTTDNPLIDVQGNTTHHGGNFQAMAVTNAAEKTRVGLQQLGKLQYSQLTELVNCSMNRGLPSCLAFEDPSTNYHTKGLDIAAAAYTSELGFLANPVNHVQPAEMANQAVNSLALISARRTAEANDVLSMLLATHLYCVCQALDLRYLEFVFREEFNPYVQQSLVETFSDFLPDAVFPSLSTKVTQAMWRRLETTTSWDLEPRWKDAFSYASSHVVDELATDAARTTSLDGKNPIQMLAKWKQAGVARAVEMTRRNRDAFATAQTNPTAQYLGKTKALYTFVREQLGVKTRRGDVYMGKQEDTIGSNVAKIYDSIKSGAINKVLTQIIA